MFFFLVLKKYARASYVRWPEGPLRVNSNLRAEKHQFSVPLHFFNARYDNVVFYFGHEQFLFLQYRSAEISNVKFRTGKIKMKLRNEELKDLFLS